MDVFAKRIRRSKPYHSGHRYDAEDACQEAFLTITLSVVSGTLSGLVTVYGSRWIDRRTRRRRPNRNSPDLDIRVVYPKKVYRKTPRQQRRQRHLS